MLTEMKVPRRYTEGYQIDDEWLNDFEEETELIKAACSELFENNPKKLITVLEKYYGGEHASLKMAINQPAIFFLLHSYIELGLLKEADLLCDKLFNNTKFNVNVALVNLIMTLNSSNKRRKLVLFIHYVSKQSPEHLKSYYFPTLLALFDGDAETFTKKLIELVKFFGITDVTEPIIEEFKVMCRKAQILLPVRKLIKEQRNEEKSEVLMKLYKLI